MSTNSGRAQMKGTPFEELVYYDKRIVEMVSMRKTLIHQAPPLEPCCCHKFLIGANQ